MLAGEEMGVEPIYNCINGMACKFFLIVFPDISTVCIPVVFISGAFDSLWELPPVERNICFIPMYSLNLLLFFHHSSSTSSYHILYYSILPSGRWYLQKLNVHVFSQTDCCTHSFKQTHPFLSYLTNIRGHFWVTKY